MPYPLKLTDDYQSIIEDMVRRKLTQAQILSALFKEYNISISAATLKRRLRKWGIRRNISWKDMDTEELRLRIQSLMFGACLSEKNLLVALQQEGENLLLIDRFQYEYFIKYIELMLWKVTSILIHEFFARFDWICDTDAVMQNGHRKLKKSIDNSLPISSERSWKQDRQHNMVGGTGKFT